MKSGLKKRKPVCFIFCEGNDNKTEVNYFSHFHGLQNAYSIRAISSKHSDLKGMFDYALDTLKRRGFNSNRGDRAYLLVDVDTDRKRNELMKNKLFLQKEYQKIAVCFSNPCFEMWFLCHFLESPAYFPVRRRFWALFESTFPDIRRITMYSP